MRWRCRSRWRHGHRVRTAPHGVRRSLPSAPSMYMSTCRPLPAPGLTASAALHTLVLHRTLEPLFIRAQLVRGVSVDLHRARRARSLRASVDLGSKAFDHKRAPRDGACRVATGRDTPIRYQNLIPRPLHLQIWSSSRSIAHMKLRVCFQPRAVVEPFRNHPGGTGAATMQLEDARDPCARA